MKRSCASTVFTYRGCVTFREHVSWAVDAIASQPRFALQDLIAGLNERPLPAEVRAREFDMSVRKLDMSEDEHEDSASGAPAPGGGIGAGSLLLSAAPKWDETPTSTLLWYHRVLSRRRTHVVVALVCFSKYRQR